MGFYSTKVSQHFLRAMEKGFLEARDFCQTHSSDRVGSDGMKCFMRIDKDARATKGPGRSGPPPCSGSCVSPSSYSHSLEGLLNYPNSAGSSGSPLTHESQAAAEISNQFRAQPLQSSVLLEKISPFLTCASSSK